MKDVDYAYAVARIRANEAKLLSASDYDSLLSFNDIASCYDFLSSKGLVERGKYESNISRYIQKWGSDLWLLLNESVPDKDVLKIFCIQNDFFNLKVALKCDFVGEDASSLYKTPTSLDLNKLSETVSLRKFDSLGKLYAGPMKEAYEIACKTENGQSAEIVLDKATLNVMNEISKESKSDLIKEIFNFLVACSDIKIALRSCRTKKGRSFVETCLCECDGLDIKMLADLAVVGEEELLQYLKKTRFSDSAELIKNNTVAFEKWCDDMITEMTKSAKYMFFGFEPVVAYYYAKLTEIKMLRLILCSKERNIPSEIIKERMRELYV